jgi:hypothetical protein
LYQCGKPYGRDDMKQEKRYGIMLVQRSTGLINYSTNKAIWSLSDIETATQAAVKYVDTYVVLQ